MKINKQGILHGILPAILITLPLGSVYAFSNFSQEIATYIGSSVSQLYVAFSLSILFLGLGAAFFGPLVEKNINLAARSSAILYFIGLNLTALGIAYKNIWLIYVGYGVINGLAQGIGYLCPVKTLVLWFPKNKGLASAISIISFGLGSSLCVYLADLMCNLKLYRLFALYAWIYFAMIWTGAFLLKKPYQTEIVKNEFKYKKLFINSFFIRSWIFMFLNIACGLVLIGSTKNILKEFDLNAKTISIILMLCGLFNGGFRLIFAWISDYIKPRQFTWLIISGISVILMAFSYNWWIIIIPSILLINATYGGGFSTCPSILSDYYGNDNLSKIHGAVLSAWGIASIPAYLINSFVLSKFNSYHALTVILAIIYFINTINTAKLVEKGDNKCYFLKYL